MKATNKQFRKLDIYKKLAKIKGARVAKKLKQRINFDFNDITEDDSLISLFIWVATKEGHDYWQDLHMKLSRSS